MNLRHKSLFSAFAWSLFILLALPTLFPNWRLLVFSPFCVLTLYRKNLKEALCIGFLTGLMIDLLASSSHIGIYALTTLLTMIATYKLKSLLFPDRLMTLPIATWIFSSVSTLLMMCILNTLETPAVLTWNWVLTDLIVLPFYDALYAFVCFVLPVIIFGKPDKPGRQYFLNTKRG